MKHKWPTTAVLLAAAGFVLAQDARAGRVSAAPEMAFFFSDSSGDLEAAARALAELRANHPSVRIRPVFLAQDFASLAAPPEDFARGLRALKAAVGEDFSLRVYDEDGLALARELKLDRLPAFAAIESRGARRRARVAYGARANLEELVRWGN